MAVPQEPSSSSEDDISPLLDVCSEEFDPLKALQTKESKIVLPFPDVMPFYSLKHYKEILRQQFTNVNKSKDSRANEEDKPSKTVSTKPLKSILTFMPEQIQGPLSILRVAMTTKQIVNVWIRHSAGVRGVCTGKIRAFDKHWNMVMYDVEECYNPIKTVSNGGKERKRRKRVRKHKKTDSKPIADTAANTEVVNDTEVVSDKHVLKVQSSCVDKHHEKWEKTRTVKQLFIRGDNVIIVSVKS